MPRLQPNTFGNRDQAAVAPARGLVEGVTGDWLTQFRWDHFITLTTRYGLTAQALMRKVRNTLIRKLAFAAGQPIPFFCAPERTTSGHTHAHALIAGTQELTVEAIRHAWPFGFTDVKVYDPSRGAAYYVSKELLANDDWDISRRLPPVIGAEPEFNPLRGRL